MHRVKAYLFQIYVVFNNFFFLAMEALGITNYNKTPPGKDKDQISSETFCHEAYVHFIFLYFLIILYICIGKHDLTN
jgi:hypothetical protein